MAVKRRRNLEREERIRKAITPGRRIKVTVAPELRIYRKRLLELIRFARPRGVTRFALVLQLRPGFKSPKAVGGKLVYSWRALVWSGRAWPEARLVTISVPANYRLGRYRGPRRMVGTPGSSGYQGITVFTPEEALLVVLAHELRHLWQFTVPLGGRVWGARWQYSERDADCYALRILRRWRRRIVPRGTLAPAFVKKKARTVSTVKNS